MLPFEEFVQARGAGLVQLGYALCGNARDARELALEVLVRRRRRWSEIEAQPEAALEPELVQAYLAWWRRPRPPRADHPFAMLTRTQRSVLVLRLLRSQSATQIADAIGRSATTVRRQLDAPAEDAEALKDFVAALPYPQGLLDSVGVKGRQLSRRRTAIGVGVAVVVLAVAAFAVPRQVEPTPKAVAPTASPSPSAEPVMRLEPAAFALPDFPLEPSYLPPHDVGQAKVFKTTNELLLEYADVSLALTSGQPVMLGTWEDITVGNQPAKLYLNDHDLNIAFVWRVGSQWLMLHTSGLAREEAQRIAEGVRPGRIAMQAPPFTIGLAPTGFTLQTANDSMLCIGRAYDVRTGAFGLCIEVAEKGTGLEDLAASNLQRTALNGLRAEVLENGSMRSELRLYLADERILRITQNALTPNSKLTPDDLLRFAAAVQIGAPRP